MVNVAQTDRGIKYRPTIGQTIVNLLMCLNENERLRDSRGYFKMIFDFFTVVLLTDEGSCTSESLQISF